MILTDCRCAVGKCGIPLIETHARGVSDQLNRGQERWKLLGSNWRSPGTASGPQRASADTSGQPQRVRAVEHIIQWGGEGIRTVRCTLQPPTPAARHASHGQVARQHSAQASPRLRRITLRCPMAWHHRPIPEQTLPCRHGNDSRTRMGRPVLGSIPSVKAPIHLI
jgi:hypothetical protein